MPQMATPAELEELKRSRERNLQNPHRANRQGQAATLGHLVGTVSPAARDAILTGTSKLQNAADSLDVNLGRALNSAGVPESWTLSEETINHPNNLKPGQSGSYTSKRIYVPRASVPVGRAASALALASMGLWVKNKLVPSDETSMNTTPMNLKAASHNASLTVHTESDTIETHKLAVRVISQQSNLISELQTEHLRVAKYAAALAQAVTLAQDGAIDVSDIQNHARQLISSGSVKLSAADDVFDQSPGELHGSSNSSNASSQRLDPLTEMLRSLPK